MTFWKRFRRIFRREAAELSDIIGDAVNRGNAALDRKECEMTATPAERLDLQRERIAETDAEFEQLRQRIDRGND